MSVASRVDRLDWNGMTTSLSEFGTALTGPLLTEAECSALAESFASADGFRSHVDMARHGFGRGEYKYFGYPLPRLVHELREAFYPQLARIANEWNAALGVERRFPSMLSELLDECHLAGQTKPTPLLLRYEAGDYNRLHQDVYGEHLFPLQLTILLSRPDLDFTGGELAVTEQRPRMQSRVEVLRLAQGEAAIFAVNHRPAVGSHGTYRLTMRHGVSRLRSGERFTLGIIFHDAA